MHMFCFCSSRLLLPCRIRDRACDLPAVAESQLFGISAIGCRIRGMYSTGENRGPGPVGYNRTTESSLPRIEDDRGVDVGVDSVDEVSSTPDEEEEEPNIVTPTLSTPEEEPKFASSEEEEEEDPLESAADDHFKKIETWRDEQGDWWQCATSRLREPQSRPYAADVPATPMQVDRPLPSPANLTLSGPHPTVVVDNSELQHRIANVLHHRRKRRRSCSSHRDGTRTAPASSCSRGPDSPPPASKVRKVHLKAKSAPEPADQISVTVFPSRMYMRVGDGIVARAAADHGQSWTVNTTVVGSASSSSSRDQPFSMHVMFKPQPSPDTAYLNLANVMAATWTLGHACHIPTFVDKLCLAGFDFIMMNLSTAVAEGDGIQQFLKQVDAVEMLAPESRTWDNCTDIHEGESDTWELIMKLMNEKTVRALDTAGDDGNYNTCFVALHKAKVSSAVYEERRLNRDRLPTRGILFGNLTLVLNTHRQDNEVDYVKVGILDVHDQNPEKEDVDVLVAWIEETRPDFVTASWGKQVGSEYVVDLAQRAGAVSFCPMFQGVRSHHGTCGKVCVHPSWYLFFGYYKGTKVPPDWFEEAIGDIDLGADIWSDMIPLGDVPKWPNNARGSPFVHNLGNIKMMKPDYRRWFDGCFQSCVWMGPTKQGSGAKARHRGRKGKHKGRKGGGKGTGASDWDTAGTTR